MPVKEIHSGGQTGGDQGGLSAAYRLGLKTAGVAPKGYRTEKGAAEWLSRLGVTESWSGNYPPRTKDNVANTQGTVIFGNISSPGCRLTRKLCEELNRPVFFVAWEKGEDPPSNLIESFLNWIDKNQIEILNVAGNRESSMPGIFKFTSNFLVKALSS